MKILEKSLNQSGNLDFFSEGRNLFYASFYPLLSFYKTLLCLLLLILIHHRYCHFFGESTLHLIVSGALWKIEYRNRLKKTILGYSLPIYWEMIVHNPWILCLAFISANHNLALLHFGSKFNGIIWSKPRLFYVLLPLEPRIVWSM